MKKRRNINFFVGIILIILNLLVDMVNPDQLDSNSKDNEYNIGYYIGSHFIAITEKLSQKKIVNWKIQLIILVNNKC